MTASTNTHRAERWISRILRGGIVVSSFCMVTGLLFLAFRPDSTAASNLMVTGLLLLMLTPFLRVTATVVAFMLERDWKFFAVALLVLLMLIGEIVYAFL